MDKKQIAFRLRTILDRSDTDSDGLVNRKMSPEHEDEIEVLLENLSLLVADLRFDVSVTRRELFSVRSLLEDSL